MNAQITRAIFKATGHADVKVFKAEGLCYFGSDTNNAIDTILSAGDAPSVYVNALNHLTVDQWVNEFKNALQEAMDNINDVL